MATNPDPLSFRPVRPCDVPRPGDMLFGPSSSGLFVPQHWLELGAKAAKAPPPPPRLTVDKLSVLAVGWRLVTGEQATIEGVVERLRLYPLGRIVDWISRITLAVNRTGADRTSARTHAEILDRFVGDVAPGLFQMARERIDVPDYPVDSMVLFHDRQTLNLLKIALLTIDPADTGQPSPPPDAFVEALLMMNDLIEPEPGSTDPKMKDGLHRLELYLTASQLFTEGTNDIRDVVRSQYLLLEPHPNVEGAAAFDPVAGLAHATGLPASTILHALYAVASFAETRSLADLDAGNFAYKKSQYLSSLPKLNDAERDRWFDLAAADLSTMQAEVRSRYSLTDLRPFDVLPFEKRPLLVLDDVVHCTSLPLLRRLRGKSLQHRLLDPSKFKRDQTQAFLDHRGHLVQRYTEELLSRTFDGRFIKDADLRALAGGKRVCDGLIVYPDAVIALECKTAHPLFATRAWTSDYEQYRAEWRDRVREAATQLASTFDLIRQGAFASVGVPADVRDFFPIVGVFELPIHHITYRAIREIDLEGHDLEARMRSGAIAPVQFLNVDDLHALEVLASRYSVVDVVRSKVADPVYAGVPFINYVSEFYPGSLDETAAWHRERFQALTNQTSAYLEELGLTDDVNG